MNIKDSNILILGLARSGLAAAKVMADRGARVTVNDLKTEDELGDIVYQAKKAGVQCYFGGHPDELIDSADMIILSPGIPRTITPVKRALDRNTPILAEVEIAATFLKEKLIGITGSNGKSTTTALTAHLLIQSGIRSRACGNIGTALSGLIEDSEAERVLAVELSSFQLESIEKFKPAIATVLNVTPDHLDRYPDFEAYKEAKYRIFENQDEEDWAVINADEVHAPEIHHIVSGKIAEFSAQKHVDIGVFASEGKIIWRDGNTEKELIEITGLSLPGPHNLLNAMAASTMALLAGATLDGVQQGLREFKALEHRLEPVEEINGILYVNDSKATNVDSTLVALQSFDRPVHLLLGGKDKDGEFKRLQNLIDQRVKQLYLIGDAADVIEAALDRKLTPVRCRSMAEFVDHATERASEGDVVLMAPGCASFDMYQNFEKRGEDFKSQVRRLMHGEF